MFVLLCDGQYSGYKFQGLRGRVQQREERRRVPGVTHSPKLMTSIVGSISGEKLMSRDWGRRRFRKQLRLACLLPSC